MSKLIALSHLSFLLLHLFPLSSSTIASPTTAHDELAQYGFPIGLLPSDVLTYAINRTTGDFAVNLGDQCKVTLPPDNYQATYSKTISGRIFENKIAQLDGIRVWALFKWWSITGILSTGDNLVFEIGLVTAKFPFSNFDEAPVCEGRMSYSI